MLINKLTLTSLLCILMVNVNALELSGSFTQGGLVTGYSIPNSIVNVEGDSIKTDANGNFAYGLKRNAPAVVVFTDAKGLSKPIIVSPREYKIQHIKGVEDKHVNPRKPEELEQISNDSKSIKLARSQFSADISFFMNKFINPINGGEISGVYGSSRTYNGEERNWHKGLDIATPTGTPVYAPQNAKVALALPMSFFNGNLIILDHGHQVFTIYAHLNSMDVKTGDIVEQGQKIAEVGTTGRSTGPHLHLGLYWRNIALDPALLIHADTQHIE